MMDGVTSNRSRFSMYMYFAWGLLAYNLPVILWGAYVRATGSGAGCGNHWPDCDGMLLPAAKNAHLVIEFSHRLSSGMDLPLTGLLLWGALRLYPRGHPVRAGALACLLLSASEALVGASLVLFKLVAHNESIYRVAVISVHLVNTFLLLAALALTAW